MENQELFEQHPIPQQISSYQFRLVGDMTLKQFFQVGGGALISIIIYSSGLAPFVKWPLVLISFLLGVGLAFFPIQDRPLERWLAAFFRSIYSPTIFKWQSTGKPYVFYQSENAASLATPNTPKTPSSGAVAPETPPVDKNQGEVLTAQIQLEKKENDFFSRITKILGGGLFGSSAADTSANTTENISPQFPPTQTQVQIGPRPGQKYDFVQTPQIQTNHVQNIPINNAQDMTSTVIATQGQQVQVSSKAQFSAQAAPPTPSTLPNVPVGQVLTDDGRIVEGAILEIRDSDGRPARAIKTNKLGHFSIATPLISGEYQIITEKDGYEFKPISLNIKGEIVPPIIVTGKQESQEPASVNLNQQ